MRLHTGSAMKPRSKWRPWGYEPGIASRICIEVVCAISNCSDQPTQVCKIMIKELP